MSNTTNIPNEEQPDVLSAYWYMLKELESKADCDNDSYNKRVVENYYKLWNRITGDNKHPVWTQRESLNKT